MLAKCLAITRIAHERGFLARRMDLIQAQFTQHFSSPYQLGKSYAEAASDCLHGVNTTLFLTALEPTYRGEVHTHPESKVLLSQFFFLANDSDCEAKSLY